MSEEITISKKNLWMYSTFILIVVLVIGGILLLSGKGNNGGGSTGGAVTGAVDLKAFTSNPSLYPSIGPSDAKNVVIEFSDFQCPFCALTSGLPSWVNDPTNPYVSRAGDLNGAAGKIEQMAEQGKIRFIYVPMSFLGQESVYASQAALCANEQGKFWEMHDAIFSAHDGKENDGQFSKDNLKKIAAKISGLDTAKFNTCLDSDSTLSDVQTVATQAKTAATSTPTFYVNGQKVSGSWAQISAALK